MKYKKWWAQSAIVSLILFGILISLWVSMDEYIVTPPQLTSNQAVDTYLDENWLHTKPGNASPIVKVKTGIYIQSLQFFNSSEVHISGYLWQRYSNETQADYIPKKGETGFIFPEQVYSGNDITPTEIYRIIDSSDTRIGWYFEATLKQPFNYALYPFDHKTVWLRLWPKDFSQNVVLTPDFDAYDATGVNDKFGIEKSIVLGAWQQENTYFDYAISHYDTNFGIPNYIGKSGFPDLRYNFVVKRKFQNAFIVYLLPLLLVAVLLFSALLTVSNDDDLASRFGSNTTGFIGACSALFFVVMLAHIQLRQQFSGASIVYIEYFYILMYIMLVVATANTFLFTIGSRCCKGIILYRDNLIPKIIYWPCVLTTLIIITLVTGFM